MTGHLEACIDRRRTLGPALWEIQVIGTGLGSSASPGQFFMAAGPGYLRHPVFPARLDSDGLAFLLAAGPDPFPAWLSSRAAGHSIDLMGPLGTGFAAPAAGQHCLMIGEQAVDVGPLLPQIKLALEASAEVLLLTGGVRASSLFPAAELPPAVEIQTATADGSSGQRGSAVDLLDGALPWADRVFAVGSRAFYRSLLQQMEGANTQALRPGLNDFIQVLLTDASLGCGVGACHACSIDTDHGPVQVCRDGPVFDLFSIREALADHD